MNLSQWLKNGVGVVAGVVVGAGGLAGQVLPTIQAGATFNDSGSLTVIEVPAEAFQTDAGAGASALARSSVVGDFHLRQEVGAASSGPGSANASTFYNLFQFDQLVFTASSEPRTVKLNWLIEYLPTWSSTVSIASNGGSGLLYFAFTATARKRSGIFVEDIRNFGTTFQDNFGSDNADVIPTLEGELEFTLTSGQTLELGGMSLQSNAQALGNANNAIFSDMTLNLWVWVDIVTPGIELLSTNSIFKTYDATPAAVPEPAAWPVWSGLAVLGFVVGRRRRRAAA